MSDRAVVHESAYVDDGATIGAGTKIWHFCHVMPGAVIGERCSLGQNVVVMNGTRIGNKVKDPEQRVDLRRRGARGRRVLRAVDGVHQRHQPASHVSRRNEYRRTLVRRGASIGANATIVCGVTLGEYAFVGAGAVVTKDVLPYALMAGVPARRIGWMCQCGERLPDSGAGTCKACGTAYESAATGSPSSARQ